MLGAARLYTTAWGLLKQPDKHMMTSRLFAVEEFRERYVKRILRRDGWV